MLKQDEKEEVKVVDIPEIKPLEEIKLPEEISVPTNTSNDQGIEVNIPTVGRVQEFPLVFKLPEGASQAQVAYAKSINAYAYQNPTKFALKKDAMIKKLLSLKNAPNPVAGNLKINNSGI
jgi:hypothetical protein